MPNKRKRGFLEAGVVLHSFSSKIILIDVTRTNYLEI